VVIVYDGAAKHIFVDGEPDGTSGSYPGPIKTTDSNVMFGKNEQQPGREFEGEMDEVRISDIARSRSWIAMQYRSMNDEVLEYGPEKTCP
ncbi:MAG TPA: LamG domain-containing protein, partial [Nannocystaceae bacterium]|nr:LamG domain-containing protein [Nannocystaceae bacterium]